MKKIFKKGIKRIIKRNMKLKKKNKLGNIMVIVGGMDEEEEEGRE